MKKNIIFLIIVLILGVTTYYIYNISKEASSEAPSEEETKIELPDSGVSEQWFKQWEEKK